MAEPITGVDGVLVADAGDMAHTRTWSLNRSADNQAYVSSDTDGATKRLKGNTDWSGSATFYLDDGSDFTLDEGDTFDVELVKDASHKYAGPAIVDSIDIEVDVEANTIIGGTIEFSANGKLTTET